MEKKIKVIHITEKLQAGGIENFIMNIYRNINREKFHFDFLVTRNENEFFEDEISKLGGKKFVIDCDKNENVFMRVLKESKEIEKFLKNNKYDVVHIHSGTPLRVFYLRAAKRAGVKKRIYHSHSAEVKGPHKALKLKKILFNIFKRFFEFYGTDFLACSNWAAKWMYTNKMIKNNKVSVINNGIDTNKFKYNKKTRNEYRKILSIEDKTKAICHIGRFNHQKNHTFLIDIFKELSVLDEDFYLYLLGEGELKCEIEEKVKRLHLEKKVKFLGVRNDVDSVMQAMDLLLLPSNYEGLPVVAIEAQASGLPIVCSNTVTDELCITNNVTMISLKLNPSEWAYKIINIFKMFKRTDTSEYIIKNGYDIKNTVKKIESIYEVK